MTKLFLAVFCFATFFSGKAAAQTEVTWHNIVNAHLPYGFNDTTHRPAPALRPFEGDLFRVTIPRGCTYTGRMSMQLWALDQNAMRTVVQWKEIDHQADPRNEYIIFSLNDSVPVMVREVGVIISVQSPYGCDLNFDQATSSVEPPPPPPPPATPTMGECHEAEGILLKAYETVLYTTGITRTEDQCAVDLGFKTEQDHQFYVDDRTSMGQSPDAIRFQASTGRAITVKIQHGVVQ